MGIATACNIAFGSPGFGLLSKTAAVRIVAAPNRVFVGLYPALEEKLPHASDEDVG